VSQAHGRTLSKTVNIGWVIVGKLCTDDDERRFSMTKKLLTVIINVRTCYSSGTGLHDFDAGKSISRAIGRGAPSNGPSDGFAPIKIIKSKRYTKKTGTLVILCT
jgi:hypothetical protein